MKGKEYINWFTEEEKSKWLDNFLEQGFQDDLTIFMERDFPKYYVFFFLGFDIHKSKEGAQYWQNIYHKNKKFDNLNVKKGFGFYGDSKQPKTF